MVGFDSIVNMGINFPSLDLFTPVDFAFQPLSEIKIDVRIHDLWKQLKVNIYTGLDGG